MGLDLFLISIGVENASKLDFIAKFHDSDSHGIQLWDIRRCASYIRRLAVENLARRFCTNDAF